MVFWSEAILISQAEPIHENQSRSWSRLQIEYYPYATARTKFQLSGGIVVGRRGNAEFDCRKRDDFLLFCAKRLPPVINSPKQPVVLQQTMQEVFCPVCSEGYFSVRPRVMPCGHSLCEACLRLTLEKLQFNCFYCKRSMVQDGKISCPVNYGLEALVRKMVKSDEDLVFNREAFRALTEAYRERIAEQLQQRQTKRKQNQQRLSHQQTSVVDLELSENANSAGVSDTTEESLNSSGSNDRKTHRVKKIRKRKCAE